MVSRGHTAFYVFLCETEKSGLAKRDYFLYFSVYAHFRFHWKDYMFILFIYLQAQMTYNQVQSFYLLLAL